MTQTDNYAQVVQRTQTMVRDRQVQQLAAEFGLRVLDITWEDTARFDNSAVGPNISDMTIQVQYRERDDSELLLSCMPVIRFPNFSDVTGDLSPEEFFLLVGNEKGTPLTKVTLRELLGDLRSYLHDPASWKGDTTSLLAEHRDRRVLVSAQACFLPIPRDGVAEFNPVLFNYQSSAGNPAVLAILATREGTSMTVIDNTRDGFEAGSSWGQRLFYNRNGERASFTGQRKSDFIAAEAESAQAAGADAAQSDRDGLNMVLLVQVPLKQKPRNVRGFDEMAADALCEAPVIRYAPSDVEDAVIGHGEVEGPFTEIDGLEIERDDRYPIRVTVQFYKATSNGVVSRQDMVDIAAQILRVYEQTDYVGSLVVDGPTGRATEYDGSHIEPPDWWDEFWERHLANTGQSRQDAMDMLRRLLGDRWATASLEQTEQAWLEEHPPQDDG